MRVGTTQPASPALISAISSNTDAFYFLRLAGALQHGETNVELECLLTKQDKKKLDQEYPENFTKDPPLLLSRAIASKSSSDCPVDLLRITNRLVIV